ncbi:hypothetical protein [Brevundimonas sp. NIBR11]|uniref:hypothetical protein n=1 Tax=Brevundimonas sp. NIBR11 TaxID=3015999 RepID=UPI0022F041F8|nr:hypothetical protein [Brevundimonas sp. NIBR11]WGM32596.1 hypothetical protein KKHFBJBL_02850 [Brevundimonas sp. NIBR11]
MSLALDPPPAAIEVLPEKGRWRLRSSDDLFSGIFLDRRTALRHAEAEADSHPGHIVTVLEA